MKAKLLKKIRKDFKFKYKHGRWHVLEFGYHKREYLTFEDALKSILEYKTAINDGDFHLWWWNRLEYQYIIKVNTRKFNKI